MPVDQGAVQTAAQADRRDGREPPAPGRAGLAGSGLLDAVPQTEDPDGADPVSPCWRADEPAGGQHRHQVPRRWRVAGPEAWCSGTTPMGGLMPESAESYAKR